MLTDQVIVDDSLRAAPGGAAFDIRIPWYRSLPYSCVEGLDVTIDGQTLDPAGLTIELAGTTYRLADLPPLHEQWWYVADAATVIVPLDSAAADAGTEHELDATLSMRIPYIIESEVPLVMRERCVKTLRLNAEAAA